MTDTQPNTVAIWATGRWTTGEDAQLASAVANTSKKMYGREYKTDWAVVTALVPGRTKKQCCNRWFRFLDPNIERENERRGKWAEDEDIRLKDTVQTHGDNEWAAVASRIPGRTKKQCNERWKNTLDPSIARTAGRTGKWSKIRRHQAERCSTNARWQELGCNCRAGSGPNENTVL
jgi:hypothetical protein